MKIRDVMNSKPARIASTANLQQAAVLVSETQVSDLMVVDENQQFVGVLSEGDLIRAALPNYEDLMQDGAPLLQAWKVFMAKGRELASGPITPIVIAHPISFAPDEELLKAAASMINRQIRILPVVQDGKLVGTISRGDLAKAVLKQ